VAGGMLVNTLLALVFIPVLYVVIRTLVPGKGRHVHDDDDAAPAVAGGAHA